LKRQRILIVDDEVYIVHILDFSLSMDGYDVVTATRGPEALSKAEREQPDLVIVDLTLDGANGIDLCREMRLASGREQIPCILLYSRDERYEAERAREAGIRAAFAKPFSPQKLVEEIREALTESGTSERAAG
jgi:two-component system alkaline phosphatase synthesis response regulator PhoP